MSSKVGILSVVRTTPFEYEFEIALSDTSDETRIHDLTLGATVQNPSGSEVDFAFEEQRILSEARDCIEARLRALKQTDDGKKDAIIKAYEHKKQFGS